MAMTIIAELSPHIHYDVGRLSRSNRYPARGKIIQKPARSTALMLDRKS